MPAARVMNGDVTIEGARAHAVYTVGDTIIVKDSTLRDLFAGGHDIEIQGTIEDDAIVAVCPVCHGVPGVCCVGRRGASATKHA